jgi:hypothetical protein
MGKHGGEHKATNKLLVPRDLPGNTGASPTGERETYPVEDTDGLEGLEQLMPSSQPGTEDATPQRTKLGQTLGRSRRFSPMPDIIW